jgi:hypothetical protein
MKDPAFPHDPTSDQFFDEARFESYRTLGFHTVLAATRGVTGLARVADLVSAAQQVVTDRSAPHPARTE